MCGAGGAAARPDGFLRLLPPLPEGTEVHERLGVGRVGVHRLQQQALGRREVPGLHFFHRQIGKFLGARRGLPPQQMPPGRGQPQRAPRQPLAQHALSGLPQRQSLVHRAAGGAAGQTLLQFFQRLRRHAPAGKRAGAGALFKLPQGLQGALRRQHEEEAQHIFLPE